MRLAASRTCCTAGTNRPISTAMMAMTTSSSISVKPRRRSMVGDCIMATPSSFLVQLRHVPDLDRMIAASRDQEPAVGAERQTADEAGVAAEVADQLARVAVPDLNDTVLTRRGDPPAILVGTERQGGAFSLASPEGLEFLPRLRVSDLDRVPLTARRQPPAIRAEGDVYTRPGDPRGKGESRLLLLCQARLVQPFRIPEFYGPVGARRSKLLAVLAKDQSADVPFVFNERADLPAGLSIPYLDGAIGFSRNQVAAVGTERHGKVGQGESFPSGQDRFEDFLFGPRVPDS